MQASDRVLAHRYALAFYEAGAKAKVEDKARQELAEALKALKPKLGMFSHPVIGLADKKKLLRRLVGEGVSAGTLRLFDLLVAKKRFGLLPAIAQNFERILEDRKGIARAQVRSAGPIDAAQQEALRKVLERFSGKTVQLDVRQAPELIGGLVVRMGDWVLDRSFASALGRMKERLAA